MGVATYTTAEDMPEQLRKALPDMEELKRILSKDDEENGDSPNNRSIEREIRRSEKE